MRRALVLLALLLALPAWATTYYVDGTLGADCTTGNYSVANRTCTGSDGNAYNTIQEAVNAAASGSGHVVDVRAGTYAECVVIQKSGASQAAPYTLQGHAGETATIDGDAANCANFAGSCQHSGTGGGANAALVLGGTFTTTYQYIRVKHLTIVPPDTGTRGYGILQGCTDYTEIDDVKQTSLPDRATGNTQTGNACFGQYEVSHWTIKNSECSDATTGLGWHFATGQGGVDSQIYHNVAHNLAGGFFCQAGATERGELAYNNVYAIDSDCDGPGGNAIMVYNTGPLVLRYNLFRDIAICLLSQRSYDFSDAHPLLILSHNTIIGRSTSGTVAINVGYASDPQYEVGTILRGNLFKTWGKAIEIRQTDCQTVGVNGCTVSGQDDLSNWTGASCTRYSEDNDAMFNVTSQMTETDPACTFTVGANDKVPGSDPLDANYCPVATTNSIIDAGAANDSVPTGGGATVDIGACESGNAGGGAWVTPYTFVAEESGVSTTPTLSWSGSPTASVDFVQMDFKDALFGAAQTKYRVQVDTTYSFDSAGVWKPLFDSGDVTSSATSAAVGTLAAGTYYARVRLNDVVWSAPMEFTVGASVPANLRGVRVSGGVVR